MLQFNGIFWVAPNMRVLILFNVIQKNKKKAKLAQVPIFLSLWETKFY